MSDHSNEDFFRSGSKAFGTFTDRDDYLHPDLVVPGGTCTETQYFGFYVPEANIYGFTYFWLRPNLNAVMGGLFICEGIKRHHLQAELFDFHQNVHRNDAIHDDLRDMRLPNSYQVQVLEPGKRMRLRYDDPALKNHVDLAITAASPVAMRANNKHFEQAMHYAGDLVLRGKSYKVDCFNVRDRSWGELRPETAMPLPPLTWTTGCFGADFAFNCSAFDHPERNPLTAAEMPISADKAFNDGWVWRDGQLIKITGINKLTTRDPVSGRPITHDIRAVDVTGREYHITGTITAGLPQSYWPNCMSHMCMTRWECDGRIGWGDTQEIQWSEFLRRFTQGA